MGATPRLATALAGAARRRCRSPTSTASSTGLLALAAPARYDAGRRKPPARLVRSWSTSPSSDGRSRAGAHARRRAAGRHRVRQRQHRRRAGRSAMCAGAVTAAAESRRDAVPEEDAADAARPVSAAEPRVRLGVLLGAKPGGVGVHGPERRPGRRRPPARRGPAASA